MLTFIQHLTPETERPVDLTLSLTAQERTRSRHRFAATDGQAIFLRLPRGTVLHDGDLLLAETGEVLKILAQPEPVMTLRAKTRLNLLRAAYHLGNRHVPLEIAPTYLRLAPDPVLKTMLEQLDVEVVEEVAPFFPEVGAYGHHH